MSLVPLAQGGVKCLQYFYPGVNRRGGIYIYNLTLQSRLYSSFHSKSAHRQSFLALRCPHQSSLVISPNAQYDLAGKRGILFIHQRRPLIATEVRKEAEVEVEIEKDAELPLVENVGVLNTTTTVSDVIMMKKPTKPSPQPPSSQKEENKEKPGPRAPPANPIPEITSSQSLPPINNPVDLEIPPTATLPRRKRVSKLVFAKFFSFVERYNEVLMNNFPKSVKNAFQVFSVGLKDFIKEMVEYGKISKKAILAAHGVRDLSGKELDVYYRMPQEMLRVAPTLLISALPFMNYFMFPIAYYFPKRLLSSHFWSLEQKSQFAIDFQKKRLLNFRPVFRSLQANVTLVRDETLKEKCKQVLDKLGSGMHPSGREIMEIKPLFESDAFSLKAIYGPHVKGLCRMHGIHTMFLNRRRLYDRAEMLHVMDMAMIREGIFNLKTEDLKSACFLRGLNASNTSHEDMMEYLQQWASISTSTSSHSYSLLLHLPILIAYNNPNNWALLA